MRSQPRTSQSFWTQPNKSNLSGNRSCVGPLSQRIMDGRAKQDGIHESGSSLKNHGLELKNLNTSPRLSSILGYKL